MLLVQVKARETVEQANFKMGPNPDETKKAEVRTEVYEREAKLKKVSDLGIIEQLIIWIMRCSN